jgi:NADH-quinone oxidoreductase subunit N
VLVVGSMISLGYYLRVVATMWMGSYRPARAQVAAVPEGSLPPIAGGSQEADGGESQEADASGSQEAGGASQEAGGGSQEAGGVPQEAGGGSQEAGGGEPETAPVAHQRGPSWMPAYPGLVFVAVVFAAATIFFGIVPQPLFHLASHAGRALVGLP